MQKLVAGAFVLTVLLVTGISAAVWSQSVGSTAKQPHEAEFYFVRLAYSPNGRHRFGQSWRQDWPEAEHHFMQGVRRLTRVDANQEGRYFSAMDDELFDYPWLYAVEVGGWNLDETEAARLREYLLRGGFLVVDDFHGSFEWEGFAISMRRVFPDRPIVEIPLTDEALHVLYDLEQNVQIPSPYVLFRGISYESDGYTPHWRGIYDDYGRLIVAINHNMDLGDAWEHADSPSYPEHYTALAYRYGINYIIYAMTH